MTWSCCSSSGCISVCSSSRLEQHPERRVEVPTEFSRFVVFWSGYSLCLAYLAALLVNSGVIRWDENGATTVAYLCMMLIFWDLLFLLEYMSVVYEKDDAGRGDEEE